MFMSFCAAVLFATASGPANVTTDLNDIQRVILKEPLYQSTPRYCLLVFGKEAGTRVWLVQDGGTLYVDRNGNGDLTEPGERVAGAAVDQIIERDGTVHKNLRVNSASTGTFSMTLGREGRRGQFVGIGRMDKPTWGDKPASAPIIHFAGPMTLERYGPMYTLPREGPPIASRGYKLRLMLGTPGLGKGTFASYDEVCSENLGPIQADIEYAGGTGPIKQRVELLHDG